MLHPIKTQAIDRGFALTGTRTFADLGGVWAVDGGYTFYARGRPGVQGGTLVDDLIDSLSEGAKQSAREQGIRLVTGNFADSATASEVGPVDSVLLFDVLLHQVSPDWDELLEIYSAHADTFVIVNPQLRATNTVRLIDLGREEYLRMVPENDVHSELFDRLDEPHRGRTWRDVHDVWQWGITDADLIATAERLGYRLVYRVDEGPWLGNSHFDNIAYVFTKAPVI
jgi:hypothetical protein